jgi:hypothetical protein
MRPIKKREIAARRPLSVRIEQVVSADVVLVDSLLDQTHSENMGVEMVIFARLGRDGGDVMDSK